MVAIDGFAEAAGRVEVSSAGFFLDVALESDNGDLFQVVADADFGTDGSPASFRMEMFLRLPTLAEFTDSTQEGFNELRTFFGGAPAPIYSFRCMSLSLVLGEGETAPISGEVQGDQGLMVRFHWGKVDPANNINEGSVTELTIGTGGQTEGNAWDFGESDFLGQVVEIIGGLSAGTAQDEIGCRVAPDDTSALNAFGNTLVDGEGAVSATPAFYQEGPRWAAPLVQRWKRRSRSATTPTTAHGSSSEMNWSLLPASRHTFPAIRSRSQFLVAF